ncbi:MAG: GNAT family N-acetyltransferase [Thermoplasmatales archaeon]|nr:GNAT family N-acetyltransferase [Thermoplasmatales archaeon]
MCKIKNVGVRDSSKSKIPPTSNVNIRSAEKKDLTAIEQLAAENDEKFDGSIENMFVAEKDGNIIGCISYEPIVKEDKWIGKYYETKNLIVRNGYLGEGIVSKLIEHLTSFAREKGMNVRFKH